MAMLMAVPIVRIQPSGRLYVGDLSQDVTEEILAEFFEGFTGIVSVKVCRDFCTGNSLGYGYVNFLQAEEAEKAMDALRFQELLGQQVRICWYNRNLFSSASRSANVFVKNLSDSIDNIRFYNIFREYGRILSSKVAMKDRRSKGYGYAQFGSEASAKKAIDNLNGQMLEGKRIVVCQFVPKNKRSPQGILEGRFTNLYVKNLDDSIDEEALQKIFSKVGKVFNVAVMRDGNGMSRGFGFVNFEGHEDARAAIQRFNGSELRSKTLFVGRAQKKEERMRILKKERKFKANLYVKNLEDGVDEDALHELFGCYGTITSAVIMRHEKRAKDVGKGRSKGFGFVCFSTEEEANDALQNLNGQLLHGKPLYVNHAEPKGVRAARFAAKFGARLFSVSVAFPPALRFPSSK